MLAVTLANVSARGTDFSGSDISMSNLSNGDFRGADFSGATLNGARLTGGSFVGADFEDAEMNRADIRGTDLSRTHGLTQEQVGRACGDAGTRLPRNLSARTCRVSSLRITPPRPPAPPTPPRRRNLVVASSE